MNKKFIIIAVSVLILAVMAIVAIILIGDSKDNSTGSNFSITEPDVDDVTVNKGNGIGVDLETGSIISKPSKDENSKLEGTSSNNITVDEGDDTSSVVSNNEATTSNNSSNTSSDNTSSQDPQKQTMDGWTAWEF